jgi:hypothetical protein
MVATDIYTKAREFDVGDVLERYAQDTRLPPEVISEHHEELMKFLSMCAACPGKYGMRGPLDGLWHTFIIFTERYANFCECVAGRFIHHFPINRADKGQPEAGDTYSVFIQDYAEAFGSEPPLHVWPRPLGKELGWPGCDTCGSACDHKCYA